MIFVGGLCSGMKYSQRNEDGQKERGREMQDQRRRGGKVSESPFSNTKHSLCFYLSESPWTNPSIPFLVLCFPFRHHLVCLFVVRVFGYTKHYSIDAIQLCEHINNLFKRPQRCHNTEGTSQLKYYRSQSDTDKLTDCRDPSYCYL